MPGRPTVFILVLLLVLCTVSVPPSVQAADPPWIEPRALNIADIAGQDAALDAALAERGGAIVSFNSGAIARFRGATVSGGKLRITVNLYPRVYSSGGYYWAYVPLLGQEAVYDHMGSASPESWLRVYNGATEITNSRESATYYQPVLALPSAGAGTDYRYPRVTLNQAALVTQADGILLPTNLGGTVSFRFASQPPTALTGVYTIVLGARPRVRMLSKQDATFQSYVGAGNVGALNPVMNQLRALVGERHSRIALNRPAGANYILFNYPPIPFDVYTGGNLLRPSSGTVRLTPDFQNLCADMTYAGAFPLDAGWQDADQSNVPPYVGYYLSLITHTLGPLSHLTPPEYVVAADTPYDGCLVRGDCPTQWLWDNILNKTMSMSILYLTVDDPPAGLVVLPLRMADDGWTPSIGEAAPAGLSAPVLSQTHRVFLPLIVRPYGYGVRPAGLFDRATGRMLYYVP
ncbi:MAG: hypothetical protein ACYC5M_11760 [Anaerolineae bacterium]